MSSPSLLFAERLRRVAMGLAADLDVATTTREALRVAAEAINAVRGVVGLLEPDGAVDIVHTLGYPKAVAERWRRIPPGALVPITDSLAQRRALIIDEPKAAFEQRYPGLAGMAEMVEHEVVAAVPLIVDGVPVGGFAFRLPRPEVQAPDFTRFLEDVALQCGLAIHRAQLADGHRSSARRLALLAEASRAFVAASPDLDAVLTTIGEHVSTAFGGSCSLSLVSAGGTHLDHVFVHHEDPLARTQLQSLMRSGTARIGEGLLGTVASTGKVVLYNGQDMPQLRGQTLPGRDSWYDSFVARFPIYGLMVVPLRLSVRILGTLAVSRYHPDQPYTAADQRLLEDLADRAAMAIENARLYTRERQARQAAESAAGRTRQLQHLTTALAGTQTTGQVVQVVVEAGAQALGAAASTGWLLSSDGRSLELTSSRGLESGRLEAYRRVSLDTHLPICEAIRTGLPMMFGNFEEVHTEYPTVKARGDFKSWAVLPIWVGGRGVGVVSLSFAEARAFQQEDGDLMISMAAQAALAYERCRAFEAEKAARAVAEEADQRKDEFLAILGHELRNPLAPIQTALDLLRVRGEPNSDGDARKALQAMHAMHAMIGRQVGQLERLVEDLLDVSHLSEGRIELKSEWLNVADVIGRAVEQAGPLLEQRRHRLTLAVPGNDLAVEGDGQRLSQVVSNLLTNAAKYTEPGGQIHLSAAREEDRVVLRVRDGGAGIAPALLPRVFDLFAQAPQGLARAQGGLGLGLTIVRRLVVLHGGQVEAHSEGPGRGSEFVVRLPIAPSDGQRTQAERPAPLPHVQRPAAVRRLLIVDDNRDAADILADGLTMVGYQVRVTHDGPAALEVAASFLPALVLLDIGLPLMDGYEVAAQLRRDFPAQRMRLVAVTGYGQEKDRARSRAAGFDEHLVKPVPFDRLLAVLARLAPDAS